MSDTIKRTATLLALRRTAREAAAQMVSQRIVAQRTSELLAEIRAILDEPLDERPGRGPTRHEQFSRLDALMRDFPASLGREGYDWGETYREGDEWVATRLAGDLQRIQAAIAAVTEEQT
ncbi:MAG TPA: hypothetical protein VNJ54_15240 [Plantibacter sp.]|uniref:hypothetical protein n=1 Tax=Plantibacter sp. TaxID=1871045 RepID=UPI002BA551FB|nr:hypothetical protein [Plantibacter sp.]